MSTSRWLATRFSGRLGSFDRRWRARATPSGIARSCPRADQHQHSRTPPQPGTGRLRTSRRIRQSVASCRKGERRRRRSRHALGLLILHWRAASVLAFLPFNERTPVVVGEAWRFVDSHGWSAQVERSGSAWASARTCSYVCGFVDGCSALSLSRQCGRAWPRHEQAHRLGSGGGCCRRSAPRSRKQPSPTGAPAQYRFPTSTLAVCVGQWGGTDTACSCLFIRVTRRAGISTTQRAIERSTPAAVVSAHAHAVAIVDAPPTCR